MFERGWCDGEFDGSFRVWRTRCRIPGFNSNTLGSVLAEFVCFVPERRKFGGVDDGEGCAVGGSVEERVTGGFVLHSMSFF